MKINKKILVLLAIATMLPLSAQAKISSDEMTTADFVSKSGYSPEMVRAVRLQQGKIDDEVVEQKYQVNKKPEVKLYNPISWFKGLSYSLDPLQQPDDFAVQEVNNDL